MAGVYIHIPFCTQRCVYCDFHTGTNISLRGRYMDSVIKEMERYRGFFDGDAITTLYFGGGTPSLLTVDDLRQLYDAVASRWDLSQLCEFTVECNPDDLTPEYLKKLRTLPVNRLSIGVQSLVDSELEWMGRRHDAMQAIEAVRCAQMVGFENISVDVMFAVPGQTLATLAVTLNGIGQLGVQHVSAYSLMFEEGSKISKLMQLGRMEPVDENVAAQMFEMISQRLIPMGFEQYEISNYALPGYESRHNSAYWRYSRYLGLGAGAHSFDGTRRWSNVAHTLRYCEFMESDKDVAAVEQLTPDERFNEYIFTALRTREGVDLTDLERRFGSHCLRHVERCADKFLKNRTMLFLGSHLSLTHQGIYISDAIISDFMIV